MTGINWDIRREGRRWQPGELLERWEGLPEKFEVIDGQLLWSEAEKLHLLAGQRVWRAAIPALEEGS